MPVKRIFGHVGDYRPGDVFRNRIELSVSGVHRPRQAGISGSQHEGADSIVLSGKYEDDVDLGDEIIYTGHGGRDEKTGKQVADQLLSDQNLALAKNVLMGLPVRVIRGSNLRSSHAPAEGYRYDGLYRITNYWPITGKSGFIVWLFRLVRIIPNEDSLRVLEPHVTYQRVSRTETTLLRTVRDTAISRRVKELYNFTCQVCGTQIATLAGMYAEAAHIRPVGSPHHGPDVLENLLCLCPNHHVMLDYRVFSIADNLDLIGLAGKLRTVSRHFISEEFLAYHRQLYSLEKSA